MLVILRGQTVKTDRTQNLISFCRYSLSTIVKISKNAVCSFVRSFVFRYSNVRGFSFS